MAVIIYSKLINLVKSTIPFGSIIDKDTFQRVLWRKSPSVINDIIVNPNTIAN